MSKFSRRGFLAAAAGLVAAGCTSAGGTSSSKPTSTLNPSASHAPTTLTVWSFSHKQNQIDAYNASFATLKKQYPWLSVQFVANKSDADFLKATTAGNPPDIYMSASPADLGQYAHGGAALNLTPLVKSAGLDMGSAYPPATTELTTFDGQIYSLPLLADSYVLYYNTKAFDEAGIKAPPKTFSELTDVAKQLTVKTSSGIQQFGFIPAVSYANNWSIYHGVYGGVKFYDDKQKTTVGSDPTWPKLLEWDSALIDYYGAKNVQDFVARYQPHSEDAGSAFITGATAMEINGEWHVKNMEEFAPKMDYGVAPFPVLDGQTTSAYGVGAVSGNPTYIAAKSKHPQEAFLAIQFLTTNAGVVDSLADAFVAVPTSTASLATWDKANDPHVKPIVDVFMNPGSYDVDATAAGSEPTTDWTNFIADYEAGKVGNLAGGLTQIAQKIDQANSQAS